MRYSELQKLTDAPEKGWVLAYTRKNVIFKPYDNRDDVMQIIAKNENITESIVDAEILEIHLFNQDREYRAISSESPRFQSVNGIIEIVVPAEGETWQQEDIYEEDTVVENNKILTIVNHVSYDDKGMASIDNYRMKVKEVNE